MYPEILSSFKLSQRDNTIRIYLDDLREILSKILGTIVVSRALASLSHIQQQINRQKDLQTMENSPRQAA